MEFGLLIIRTAVGLTLAAHGAQKLFGSFGGRGLAKTGGMFESMGFRPGNVHAALAGLGETCGGLALALGVLTPLASAVAVATMVVAVWGVIGLGLGLLGGIPALWARGRSTSM